MPPEKRDYLTPEEVAKLDPFKVREKKLDEETASLEAQAPPLKTERNVENEISDEVIGQNQAMLDFVFGQGSFNLREAYQNGEILAMEPEQAELAEKEGYALSLIVPGQMPRAEMLKKIKARYAQVNSSQGIFYSEQATQDLNKITSAQASDRPNQFYLIKLKPQTEVNEAHPETMDKTPTQLQAILKQTQEENPDFNLRGLNLQEYLLADALCFQNQQRHLDERTWEYLLEETVPNIGRALDAGWRSGARRVDVFSDSSAIGRGARFAAVSQAPPSGVSV